MFNFALGKTKTFVLLQNKGKKFKRKEKKFEDFFAMSCSYLMISTNVKTELTISFIAAYLIITSLLM